MLETLDQALGALGGVAGAPGGHGAHDLDQLALDARGDAAGPAGDEPVETLDGPLEAAQRLLRDLVLDLTYHQAVVRAPGLQIQDPSHARIVARASDTPVEVRGTSSDVPIPTHARPRSGNPPGAAGGAAG